ncbi:MAG: hypothetical protein ACHQ0Y_02120 [Thermodesulfovibrionales bacterium]|jgi:hypothetical protein
MKRILSFILMLIIAAILTGCATYQYQDQGDRTPEMHPGHTGHEVHY